jgi:hypothetical protein
MHFNGSLFYKLPPSIDSSQLGLFLFLLGFRTRHCRQLAQNRESFDYLDVSVETFLDPCLTPI